MTDTPIPADVLEAARRLWFDDLNFANDRRGAIPIIALAFLADRAAQAERMARLEEALKPFAEFGRNNTDDEGWSGLRCERERIVDWFGPSEFRAAREGSEPS